jgi:1,4-alpha-glucan branching enzyme
MHDTLMFFSKDPIHRRFHLNDLTFAMLYEHTERFLMPLSHDEVVHGKRSLLERMPGDEWQRFANLRLLLAYQFTRPGKKLLFMGTEIAPWHEWNYRVSLDWHLAEEPLRKALMHFMETLGRYYQNTPALWRGDHEWGGFQWVDCNDRDNTVLSYARWSEGDHRLIVLNLTPVPRDDYRVGAPAAGDYELALCTDAGMFGGSEYPAAHRPATSPAPLHGQGQSLRLSLPPLSALIYQPVRSA